MHPATFSTRSRVSQDMRITHAAQGGLKLQFKGAVTVTKKPFPRATVDCAYVQFIVANSGSSPEHSHLRWIVQSEL